MAERYPIRSIAADEFAELAAVPEDAFGAARPPAALERDRLVIEYDRTIAAFDGAQMIGSAAAYSFQLTVPGATAAAAGITYVAVQPTHRRRGVLSGLMDWLLADADARKETLAILFASEAGIYRRFGFGMASQDQRFRFGRGEGALTAGPQAPGPTPRLRAAAPAAARQQLASVFDAVCARQTGMLARDSRWWDYVLTDPPALRPAGASPLRCVVVEDDHGPRGYALFRTEHSWGRDHLPAGSLQIRELIAADPAATAALWSDLLSRDLISEIIAPMRPMDDPLLAMLADPRRARPSPSDALWVRLVDLPGALRSRQYAAAADLVLEVADPERPANTGRWRLRTPGPAAPGQPACEPTDAPADLRMPVAALGAAYLGRPCLGQLAAAGYVAELTPGSLCALAAAMCWEPAPFSPMVF